MSRRTRPGLRPRTRHRGRTRPPEPAQRAVIRQAVSVCLEYPDRAVRERLALARTAMTELASHPAQQAVAAFTNQALARGERELAEHYVQVFDTRNRRSLHLTWWSDGDTRRRGMSLVRLGRHYRAHGWRFDADDLPDYLPAVLEFAAFEPDAGEALLLRHRGALDLLRLALGDAETPYALLLDAVCATLPDTPGHVPPTRPGPRGAPPVELVGLDAAPLTPTRSEPPAPPQPPTLPGYGGAPGQGPHPR